MEIREIVHICFKQDWDGAIASGIYQPDSLRREGFIHFSRPDQVLRVANTYFVGQKDLLLIRVDTEKLDKSLRWEDSQGDIYPHLYGSLNLDAVIGVSGFSLDDDGVFRDLPHLEV